MPPSTSPSIIISGVLIPHCGLAGLRFSTTIATALLPFAFLLYFNSPVSGLPVCFFFVVVSVVVVVVVVVVVGSGSSALLQAKSVKAISIARKTARIFFIFNISFQIIH